MSQGKTRRGRVCYDCHKIVLGPGSRLRLRGEAIPVLVCDDCAPDWRRGAREDRRGRGVEPAVEVEPRQASLEVPPEAQGGGPATPRRPLNRVGRAPPPPPGRPQGPERGSESPPRPTRAAGDREAVERLALRILGILGEAPLTAAERTPENQEWLWRLAMDAAKEVFPDIPIYGTTEHTGGN